MCESDRELLGEQLSSYTCGLFSLYKDRRENVCVWWSVFMWRNGWILTRCVTCAGYDTADSTTGSEVEVETPTVQAFVRMVKTVLLPTLVEDYSPDEDDYSPDEDDYSPDDEDTRDCDVDSWMSYSHPPRKHPGVSCTRSPPLYVSHYHHHHQQQQQQPQQQQQTDVTCPAMIMLANDDDVFLRDYPDSSGQRDTHFRPQVLTARTSSSSPVLPTDLVNLESLTTPVGLGSSRIPLPRAMNTSGADVARIPTGNGLRSLLKRKLSMALSESSVPCSSSGDGDVYQQNVTKRRFTRTAETLERLGLVEVAMRTGNMLLRGRQLQNELVEVRRDLRQLMMSVLRNPENQNLKKALVAMKDQLHGQKEKCSEKSKALAQS